MDITKDAVEELAERLRFPVHAMRPTISDGKNGAAMLRALFARVEELTELAIEVAEWNWIDFREELHADPDDAKMLYPNLCDIHEKVQALKTPSQDTGEQK